MQFLLFLTIFLTINADLLNEFSGDVDYYDMGVMGRGKNAGSWHHSFETKQEVFYYLAMQPWRHLVWTKYDEKEGEWYKYIINEDASNIPDGNTKLQNVDSQDYCRKEYAHEMRRFEIDWERVPQDKAAFETADVNGETCFKYPAKLPLVNVYLDQAHSKKPAQENFKICRMEFVGGRSITFRSFNIFSKDFVSNDKTNGYNQNLTKCIIDPSPNNLDSDLSIVLGISDKSVTREMLPKIRRLADLKTIKTVKLYYMKGAGYEVKTYDTKEAFSAAKDYDTLTIQAGTVDALINIAKNDMVTAMGKKGLRKGTIVVFIDKTLASSFDAETAFDRNGISVHVVGFNSQNKLAFRMAATTLLSLGEHYHEFTAPTGLETAMENLYKGIRVNLTERCDRTKCNGFCDGRDRCTCPMCCENDCFYTYCDVDTATCTPWPKANPKKKIECQEDCVGERVCEDLVGCVIKRYNPGCAPPAKCMRPYCNATSGFKCAFEDTCGRDLSPSLVGNEYKCREYVCDQSTGMCKSVREGAACEPKTNNCHDYVCDDNLVCSVVNKTCVKTSPYIEMDCYVAVCNERTGQCENRLSCDNWVGCAAGDVSACRCDSTNGFKCTCQTDKTGFCTLDQICDTRGDKPECKISQCNQDLYKDSANCRYLECDTKTNETYWEYLDCNTKIGFEFDSVGSFDSNTLTIAQNKAKEYCLSLYSTECDGNDGCRIVESTEPKDILCGSCYMKEGSKTVDGKVIYTIAHKSDCALKKATCGYGDGRDVIGKCDSSTDKCYYPLEGEVNVDEMCAKCVGTNLDCPLDLSYRTYAYNEKTGKCTVRSTEAKGCQECNKGLGVFESNCVGDVEKVHLTSDVTTLFAEKRMTYTIPKVCMYGNQCVPEKEVNCMPEKDEKNGIYEIWQLYKGCNQGHDGYAVGSYHYSDKFDENLYDAGKAQSAEFLAEAEEQAYCEWTLKTKFECTTCDPVYKDDSNTEVTGMKWNDNCPRQQGKYLYICSVDEYGNGECIPDPNVACPTHGCTLSYAEGGACKDDTEENLCTQPIADVAKTLDTYRESVLEQFRGGICVSYPVCEDPNAATQSKCSYKTSNENCTAIYKKYEKGELDFGCYRPVAECDENTYYCKYAKIEKIEDDVDYYIRRSGVVKNNACYGYECVETYDMEKKQWTHEWKLKEEYIAKQNPKPRHKCETAVCNPETGEPKYTDILCDVNEQFPTLGGNQSECFYCQCSYTDGSFVLSMFADTAEKTYSLDACGSCIVTERETGKILNDVPECILKQELNLTGAIAGATVAASVVFALVGAMAVVSIGLFQTYQLVTSALKNAITTTVENAEFVAADNEATNVLNTGDN